MGRFVKHIAFIVAVALLAGAVACDSEGCEGNQSSLPLAGFYSSQTKSNVSVDSLTVYGVGVTGDSAIIRNAVAQQVYLPFNLEDTVTRFVFRYERKDLLAAGITDTVTVTYDKYPFFHSSDCGAMYNFNIHSYSATTNLIDSVRMPVMLIDNTNVENFQIYFRTQQEEDSIE